MHHHLVLLFIRAGTVRMVTCIVASKIFALFLGNFVSGKRMLEQEGGTFLRHSVSCLKYKKREWSLRHEDPRCCVKNCKINRAC